METPFRSGRLIYRAVEPSEDEDFFFKMQQDPIAYRNSNTAVSKPQSRKSATDYMNHVEESLLGVVICLPGPTPDSTPVPIGCISLSPLSTREAHHRFANLAVDIIAPYQGQGYGTEAINWSLEWAFETAGLHRVNVSAFAYNEGALRLYKRLGFVQEGLSREMYWHAGRWYDDVQFGLLDREWHEMKQRTVASRNVS